jgi:aryl-alcohol dehydrogenase-like predicted oxidoreductase
MSGSINRRDFVRAGTAAAVGASTLAGASAADAAPRINGMPTVKLPRWDGAMPIFGYGSALFIKIYTKLSREEQIEVIRYAYDQGLRYFDTANSYGTEGVVGEALKDVREDVFLNTKISFPADPSVCRRQLENSFKTLQTDYIDCVKVHCPYDYDYGMRVADIIEDFRKEGRVRLLGFSNHIYFEQSYKLVDSGRFDEILISRGYFPVSDRELYSQRNVEFRDMVVARAHALDMNIIGMKALSAGILGRSRKRLVPDYPEERAAKLAGAAIRWAYSDPRIHLYVIGISFASEIDENVRTFQGDMGLSNDDQFMLADYSTRVWADEKIAARPEPFSRADSPRYISKGTRAALERAGIEPPTE